MSEKDNINDVTLIDMMKVVLKKWKMLICVLLVAVIVCGGIGAVISFSSNQNYGTRIEFYVTSEKANRYILSLIQSDSFAEELLMDKNSLPAAYSDTEEYKSALEVRNQIAKLEAELATLEEELLFYPRKVSDAQKLSNEAQTAYNEIYNHLTIMYASADAANYKEQIIKAENDLTAAKAEKDRLKSEYNRLLSEQEDKKEDVSEITLDIDALKDQFFAGRETLLEKFRKQNGNASKILNVKSSISYSYADSQDTDSQAVLYVNVSVHNNESLAKHIVDVLPQKLPEFVSDNVNQEVSCVCMSAVSNVQKIEKNPLVSTVLLYGGIGAALALFVSACGIVVVYVSKPDKKVDGEN